MHEEIMTITGPIKFGCDPKGQRAGVTLRFNVVGIQCDVGRCVHKNHRLVLGYKQYWQMLLTSGVQDVQNLEGHRVIVEVWEDGKVKFSRYYEG